MIDEEKKILFINDLKLKKIDKEKISSWISVTDDAWLEIGERVLQRKFKNKTYSRIDDISARQNSVSFEEKTRQKRFLAYRGFSACQIQQLVP